MDGVQYERAFFAVRSLNIFNSECRLPMPGFLKA